MLCHFRKHPNLYHFMKLIYTIFIWLPLSFLFSNLHAQSTTWIGDTNQDWGETTNWTAGVPDASLEATIQNVANTPIIMNGTDAIAKSVVVETDAYLTIESIGSLTIDGSVSNGLENNGTVENNGKITIGANTKIGQRGIFNEGILNNNIGSNIQVEETGNDGIRNTGTFNNHALITIGSNKKTNGDGIDSNGSFTNHTDSEIWVDETQDQGIFTLGDFTNHAKIILGANKKIGRNGINNSGNFINETGAEIRVEETGNDGVKNQDIFINKSKIFVGLNKIIGERGVFNGDQFTNEASGVIQIEETVKDGMEVNGPFNNWGLITIGVNKQVGEDGIIIWDLELVNEPSGIIQIEGAAKNGIYNTSDGGINNKGKITIGANKPPALAAILNESPIDNQACGEIILYGQLSNDPSSTITNNGLFQLNRGALHALGTFINDGVVVDLYGSLPNNPPSFTNNDLFITPIASNSIDATNALHIGGVNDFNADYGWYSDAGMTTWAGDYDMYTNTFTLTDDELGSRILYFNVSGNGCSYDVPISTYFVSSNPACALEVISAAPTSNHINIKSYHNAQGHIFMEIEDGNNHHHLFREDTIGIVDLTPAGGPWGNFGFEANDENGELFIRMKNTNNEYFLFRSNGGGLINTTLNGGSYKDYQIYSIKGNTFIIAKNSNDDKVLFKMENNVPVPIAFPSFTPTSINYINADEDGGGDAYFTAGISSSDIKTFYYDGNNMTDVTPAGGPFLLNTNLGMDGQGYNYFQTFDISFQRKIFKGKDGSLTDITPAGPAISFILSTQKAINGALLFGIEYGSTSKLFITTSSGLKDISPFGNLNSIDFLHDDPEYGQAYLIIELTTGNKLLHYFNGCTLTDITPAGSWHNFALAKKGNNGTVYLQLSPFGFPPPKTLFVANGGVIKEIIGPYSTFETPVIGPGQNCLVTAYDHSNAAKTFHYDGNTATDITPGGSWYGGSSFSFNGTGLSHLLLESASDNNMHLFSYDGSSTTEITPAGTWPSGSDIRTDPQGNFYFYLIDANNERSLFYINNDLPVDITPATPTLIGGTNQSVLSPTGHVFFRAKITGGNEDRLFRLAASPCICSAPIATCQVEVFKSLDTFRTVVLHPHELDMGSEDCNLQLTIYGLDSLIMDCDSIGSRTYPLEVLKPHNGLSDTCYTTITIDDYQFPCCPPDSIIYVDGFGFSFEQDGASWTTAFRSLQRALEMARFCSGVKEIWVTSGFYFPDDAPWITPGDRTASFSMIKGVSIYGGFQGWEQYLSDRDLTNIFFPSALCGGFGEGEGEGEGPIGPPLNSYHVIFNEGNGIDHTAVLDGFVIHSGQADGLGDHEKGGGMFNRNASPTVRNCFFDNNMASFGGGAVYNFKASPIFDSCSFSLNVANIGGAVFNSTDASTTINYCSFVENNALEMGGAIFNNTALLNNIQNSFFEGNTSDNRGGAIHNVTSSPEIINCAFLENTALEGAAISNQSDSEPTITNCSFYGNVPTPSGGAIRDYTGSYTTLTNSILWGNTFDTGTAEIITSSQVNPVVTYSIVQQPTGVWPGTGNLNEDPLYGLCQFPLLHPCSPALDKGLNSANPTLEDLKFQPRKVNTIDLGACEFQGDPSLPIHWTGYGDGLYWDDPFNWDLEVIPGQCQSILIPGGHQVIVPTGFKAIGQSLEVELGAELETEGNAETDIGN